MNLVLLEEEDFIDAKRVRLSGRRFDHIVTVLAKGSGETLRVGRINGLMGQGTITTVTSAGLILEVELNEQPPPPLAVTLILALPRPKMLRRILQSVTAMGVKQLYLINSYRVDKSYWASPLLTPYQLDAQLRLGLEQARDTLLPQIYLRQRFKPFAEDELPSLCAGKAAYVAHPIAEAECSPPTDAPILLAVGPEGGFIPYEVDKLRAFGALPISLGPRILRVETALPVLLARLAC
jgi:16S rRNA (uracil1498-N3)-methyltransferase